MQVCCFPKIIVFYKHNSATIASSPLCDKAHDKSSHRNHSIIFYCCNKTFYDFWRYQ